MLIWELIKTYIQHDGKRLFFHLLPLLGESHFKYLERGSSGYKSSYPLAFLSFTRVVIYNLPFRDYNTQLKTDNAFSENVAFSKCPFPFLTRCHFHLQPLETRNKKKPRPLCNRFWWLQANQLFPEMNYSRMCRMFGCFRLFLLVVWGKDFQEFDVSFNCLLFLLQINIYDKSYMCGFERHDWKLFWAYSFNF